MSQPYLSDEQIAGRISCHGKITSLTSGFKLKNGNFFSLFIIPTVNTVVTREVSVKLHHEDAASACPFAVNCWTETSVRELPANSINLTENAVYWGAPCYDEPVTL